MSRWNATPDRADCYVYVLFRLDGRPFYVGKGRGRRWLYHEIEAKRRITIKHNAHRHRIVRQILSSGCSEIPKVKIAENLTDQQAMDYEVAFISAIGRGENGPLVNLTDGGEGISGWKMTDAQREALSKLAKQRGAPPPLSAEARERIAAARRGKKLGPLPPETRQKMSLARRGKKLGPNGGRIKEFYKRNPEKAAALSAIRAAGRVGKKLSQAAKDKISASRKGRSQGKHTPEARAKIAAAKTGLKLSAAVRAKISATKRSAFRAVYANDRQLSLGV